MRPERRHARRLAGLACAAAWLAAGCGEPAQPAKGPPGSPDNPLVSAAVPDGQDPDAPAAGQPGFAELVDRQSARPGHRRSPCALVTRREAERALGAELADPFEAPQGPTCIYRSASGDVFVTVGFQRTALRSLRGRMGHARRVRAAGRRGYCGMLGGPALALAAGPDRVLVISAHCRPARRLATRAVPRMRR